MVQSAAEATNAKTFNHFSREVDKLDNEFMKLYEDNVENELNERSDNDQFLKQRK